MKIPLIAICSAALAPRRPAPSSACRFSLLFLRIFCCCFFSSPIFRLRICISGREASADFQAFPSFSSRVKRHEASLCVENFPFCLRTTSPTSSSARAAFPLPPTSILPSPSNLNDLFFGFPGLPLFLFFSGLSPEKQEGPPLPFYKSQATLSRLRIRQVKLP